jgi:hypothetical protein
MPALGRGLNLETLPPANLAAAVSAIITCSISERSPDEAGTASSKSLIKMWNLNCTSSGNGMLMLEGVEPGWDLMASNWHNRCKAITNQLQGGTTLWQYVKLKIHREFI